MNLPYFTKVDSNTKVRTAAIILSLVLGASALALSYTSTSIGASYSRNSGLAEYTYMIFGDGTKTYARNGMTGAIEFSSTDSATVINNVLSVINTRHGGTIYVKGYGTSHPYIIKSALIIPDSGHLTFYGDGPEYTVLQVPPGYDNDLFVFTGIKSHNAFFNTFRDFEGIGNRGEDSRNNSGFKLNATGFGVTDSLWTNVFLRGFKMDDVYIDGPNSWNNRFETSTFEHAGRAGIYRTGGEVTSDIKVTNSKFLYNDQYGVYDNAVFATYANNWFYKNVQTAFWAGDTFRDSIIMGNRFEDNSNSTNNRYDDLHLFRSDLNVITGNFFYGSERTDRMVRYGIYVDSFSIQNSIMDNSFGHGNFGTNKIFMSTSSQTSVITDNPDWNPVGTVASPFSTTANTIVPMGGNAAKPNSSTDYVVRNTPIVMSSTGGTGVSITIKDANGNTITSGITTLSYAYIPVGYRVNFGAFNVAPTVKIGFN
jgi:hypothetical protein